MVENRSTAKMKQLVSFRLANEEFAVEILKVQEIMRFQEITQVPQLPDFVEGVINLRGNVIPIIDLRKKFGFEMKEKDALTRIIVVNVQNKIMGLVVDAVEQVLRLSEDQIEPPPDVGISIGSRYLKGVGKLDRALLILLDLNQLLSSGEYSSLDKVKQDQKEDSE